MTNKEDIETLAPITAQKAFYVKCNEGMEERKVGFIAKGVVPSPVFWVPFEVLSSPTSTWKAVEETIRHIASDDNTENVIRKMRPFYESEADVLWVTIFNKKLWWCFSERKFIELPDTNQILKTFRPVIGRWRNCAIDGKPLLTTTVLHKMPSVEASIQRNKELGDINELDYLVNKINGTLRPGRKPKQS